MALIQITKDDFERYIHAAAVCDETIYDAVLPYIERSENEAKRILLPVGVTALDNNTVLKDATKAYMCEIGFIKALRHLDLVLTDSGFGVVSNDHVAPASAERVSKLEEALWIASDKSQCDMIRELILVQGWGAQPSATHVVNILMWDILEAPDMCGVGELTHKTWVELKRDMFDAEFKLAIVIGYEVLTELLQATVNNNPTDVQRIAIEIVKAAVASMVANKDNQEVIKQMKARVINWFDAHKDDFDTYTNSSAYKARQVKRYENTQNSPAYFFG